MKIITTPNELVLKQPFFNILASCILTGYGIWFLLTLDVWSIMHEDLLFACFSLLCLPLGIWILVEGQITSKLTVNIADRTVTKEAQMLLRKKKEVVPFSAFKTIIFLRKVQLFGRHLNSSWYRLEATFKDVDKVGDIDFVHILFDTSSFTTLRTARQAAEQVAKLVGVPLEDLVAISEKNTEEMLRKIIPFSRKK